MTTKELSSLSLEYVRVPIKGPADLTVPVEAAFTAGEEVEPLESDWVPATWDVQRGRTYALALVGPGGAAVLADGTWMVWVRFAAGDERPVLLAGELVVT